MWPSESRELPLRVFIPGILALLVAGCGSGSGGSEWSAPPPPPADFSIAVVPTSVNLSSGGNQTCTVSVSGINGFAGIVSVSSTGLPTGVTASPASFSLSPGGQQKVNLAAAATVQPGASKVTFQATSGSLSHSSQLSLDISVLVTAEHAPIRTRYLRTNGFSGGGSETPLAVYDPVHKRFLVSNTFMNEIDVFDAVQEVETARIPVPQPWGLDISPYNGSLYAGTLVGDIYQVDTSSLAVTTRYPAASIGPSGFAATAALVLSDGRLALQGQEPGFAQFPGVAQWPGPVVWNPETNSLDTGPNGNGSVCPEGSGGAFALSGDRTKILSASIDEGPTQPVCSYDPIAKVAVYGSFPFGTFVFHIIPTPDGKQFFLLSEFNGVGVFDAKTAQMVGQIPGPASYVSNGTQLPNDADSGVVSTDGKTLYLMDTIYGVAVGYDTTTYQPVGYVPAFKIQDAVPAVAVLASAIDETGLLFGGAGSHGAAFIDAAAASPTLTSVSSSGDFPTPSVGPEGGGIPIESFSNRGALTPVPQVTAFYIGNGAASGVTQAIMGSNSLLDVNAITPAATQGLFADVTLLYSDGSLDLFPEAFSYGPTIVEVVPNAATADGGQTGALFGYGFGSTTSGVQITVNGQNAPVVAIYPGPPVSPYPFPTEGIQFVIPPGSAGSAVDVTLTTPNGTATAKAAFHYTTAAASYPTTASLQAGIYDSQRDLYYFTDAAQIQVLSVSGGKWLTPITLPGTSGNSRLTAISESPDKTKLAVSDFGGQAIYVLSPDNRASVQRFPMPLTIQYPAGLAVANSGIIFYATPYFTGSTSPIAYHELNVSTGLITDLGTVESMDLADDYVRVLLSPDGSRMYSCINLSTFWLDTSNDQFNSVVSDAAYGDIPEEAISGDGSTLDIESSLDDSSLNQETGPAYIDWETWLPTATVGQKLSQDGGILFQPLTDGVDILPRNTGQLLYRVQIPGTVANVYDSLVVGPGTNALAVITTTGVSILDFSALPIPASDSQPFPAASRKGTAVRAMRRPVVALRSTIAINHDPLGRRPRLKYALRAAQISVAR